MCHRPCRSGHSGCVNRLCWNESGSLLASGSDDRKVRLELLSWLRAGFGSAVADLCRLLGEVANSLLPRLGELPPLPLLLPPLLRRRLLQVSPSHAAGSLPSRCCPHAARRSCCGATPTPSASR